MRLTEYFNAPKNSFNTHKQKLKGMGLQQKINSEELRRLKFDTGDIRLSNDSFRLLALTENAA